MHEGPTGSIGPDELADAQHRGRQGVLVAVAGVLVVVVALVGVAADLPAWLCAAAITGGLLLATMGVSSALHHRKVVAVGTQHPWRLEQVAVRKVGEGKRAYVRLQLSSCLWEHDPWNGRSNTSTLLRHEQLEVAGDPRGELLVRVPGDRKVRIFKPQT